MLFFIISAVLYAPHNPQPVNKSLWRNASAGLDCVMALVRIARPKTRMVFLFQLDQNFHFLFDWSLLCHHLCDFTSMPAYLIYANSSRLIKILWFLKHTTQVLQAFYINFAEFFGGGKAAPFFFLICVTIIKAVLLDMIWTGLLFHFFFTFIACRCVHLLIFKVQNLL